MAGANYILTILNFYGYPNLNTLSKVWKHVTFVFQVWVTSLSTIISSSVHLLANLIILRVLCMLVIFHIFITHSSADGQLGSFLSQRSCYGSTYIILNNSRLLSKKIVILKDDWFTTSIKIDYRSLAWKKLGSLACKNTAFIRTGRLPRMERRRSCSGSWLQWLSCHLGLILSTADPALCSGQSP